MMTFDDAFTLVLGHEGAYSNDPRDPGGETMWGITAYVAHENGYFGKMIDLPQDKAKEIYRAKYWDAVQADAMPDGIRFDLFDAAVNSGPDQAILWLQRAVHVADDGLIGPITLAAAVQAGQALSARFNGERLMFMTKLSRWPVYGKGWARRIALNLQRQE